MMSVQKDLLSVVLADLSLASLGRSLSLFLEILLLIEPSVSSSPVRLTFLAGGSGSYMVMSPNIRPACPVMIY